MAVDFATFLSTAPFILDARLPILIRGRHGVGDALHRADVARGETRDCFRPLPARPRSRVASRVRRTSRFAHDARCFAGETFD